MKSIWITQTKRTAQEKLNEHEKYLRQLDFSPKPKANKLKELGKKRPGTNEKLNLMSDHRKEKGSYTANPSKIAEITKDHWEEVWKEKVIPDEK